MTTLVTMIASVLLIAFAVAGLALGVLGGRAPLAGSCGGLGGGACVRCGSAGKCRAGVARRRDTEIGSQDGPGA